MIEFLRRRGYWILIGAALAGLLLRYGGVTVLVRNQSFQTICAVQISRTPDLLEAGPNRLGSALRYPQSRDVRLPLLWSLFVPAEQRRLYAWAWDCAGHLIEAAEFSGGDNLFDWLVDGR
ncbi:MAG: hypothetical protein ABWK53_05935 [Anaerolineales bacterium]